MLSHHPDHFRRLSCYCAARAFSFTSFASATYNSFRIHTYEKSSCKSFRIRTCKKVGGGGYADSLTQGRAPVASGGSLCSAYNSTFDFQLSTSSSVRMPGMWGEQQCHL